MNKEFSLSKIILQIKKDIPTVQIQSDKSNLWKFSQDKNLTG